MNQSPGCVRLYLFSYKAQCFVEQCVDRPGVICSRVIFL